MYESTEEVQLTKLESIFVLGIVGCLLFATWEVMHLCVDEWFQKWVEVDPFVRRRVIMYGISSVVSMTAVFVTTRYAFSFGRFGKTVNRAFLWYGTILLISTIAIFVLDCLPEVVAGFFGAIVFLVAIFFLQKRYFTRERVLKNRMAKNLCFACAAPFNEQAMYCQQCGVVLGNMCDHCGHIIRVSSNYCGGCGIPHKNSNAEVSGGS
jgi:hypothetical protein